MTYKLQFKEEALKEWQALDDVLKKYFKKKLQERLAEPHIPSARLSGLSQAYKIKHQSSGYRLVYQVQENEVVVLVLAVGRRQNNQVYKQAQKRQQ